MDWKSYLLSFPSPLDLALIVRGECKYGSVWGDMGNQTAAQCAANVKKSCPLSQTNGVTRLRQRAGGAKSGKRTGA